MILSLLFTTLLIPLFITAALLYAFERSPSTNVSTNLVVIIAWLPLYVWIVQTPNFPPKQASDWLWIYLIISGLGTSRISIFSNNKVAVVYQIAIFWIACLVIAWPAISYNASLASHWFIWLESLFFGLVGSYVIGNPVNGKLSENKRAGILENIYLWLVTGALGLIVIMTGSLLIGTLSIALSSIYLCAGVYSKFYSKTKAQVTASGRSMSYGLILLTLLLSRIYVEVDSINTLLLLISIALSGYLTLKHNQSLSQRRWVQFIFLLCLAAAVGYSLYTEVLSHSNNKYY